MMSRIFCTVLIAVVLQCLSGPVSADEAATAESAFAAGFGARPSAMGGAFVAVSEDPHAVYYNPAGLGAFSATETFAGYSYLSRKAHSGFCSLLMPAPGIGGCLGFALIGVQVRDRFGGMISRVIVFDDSRFSGQLSYGRQLPWGASLGGSLKAVRRKLHQADPTWGSTLDLGFRKRIVSDLALGIAVRDITVSGVELDGSDESPSATSVVGLSYQAWQPGAGLELTGTLDLEWVGDETVAGRIGLEMSRAIYQDVVGALRGGYNGEGLSLGAGISWKWLKVDYAVARLSEDACFNSYGHSISVSILPRRLFSELPFSLKSESVPPPLTQSEIIGEYRLAQYERNKEKADAFLEIADYDRALIAYYQAHAFAESESQTADVLSGIATAEDGLEREARARVAEPIVDFEQQLKAREKEIRSEWRRSLYDEAGVFFRGRQYDLALDRLSSILEDEPGDSVAAKLKAEIEEAVQLEKVFNLFVADRAEARDSLIKALKYYNATLRLDSTSARALDGRKLVEAKLTAWQYCNIGARAYRAGRRAQARYWFEQAMLLNPREATAGEFLSEFDSLLRAMPVAEGFEKDSVNLRLYQEGMNHYRKGQYQKAIDAWQKVLETYPNHPSVLQNIEEARRMWELHGQP